MSRQPPDLVAVMFGNEAEYIPCNGWTGTSMPYSAAEVTDSSHWADDFGWQDAGSLYSYDASFDGQVLAAHLWLGREASGDDMARGVGVGPRSGRSSAGTSIVATAGATDGFITLCLRSCVPTARRGTIDTLVSNFVAFAEMRWFMTSNGALASVSEPSSATTRICGGL
jgi:hypothetical protein